MPERLPMWKKWMYALGQLGWSLTSFAVGNTLVYFYMPPEGVQIPQFIQRGAVFFGLTIVGLVLGTSRLFDAVTDPLVATLSDRSTMKLGRRRGFLAISVLPFAVLSFLPFFPPSQNYTVNTIWLFATVIAFYWFMTMYVTPFFAWMSELGHDPNERLLLSTLISVTWAIGYVVGTQIYLFQTLLENAGLTPVRAFQIVTATYGVIGFFLMLLPVIFIDENRYCEKHTVNEGGLEAIVNAFKERNFLVFVLQDLLYWVGLTGISLGLVYYVTVLLKLPKEQASTVQLMMFLLSFLFYVPINVLARKIGKKKLLMVGFIVFSADFAFTALLGRLPLSPQVQSYIVAVLSSIPLAIFGILPNAMVADIAEAHGRETGNYKAAVFFGARTFMQKMGQTVAGLIYPSIFILGRNEINEFGLRLSAIISLIFMVLGYVLLLFYNEAKILKVLANELTGSRD
ncbi:MFS transporter [Fervidobacterium thailandense]|uniref:MFS transporter n=1 Tax=Fervidobacterium thailandense TaxID=1008305 RepID=A0A1E3G1M6_9BACT|nr:MFS transporter [Fervidobacterium thailandense]ODN30157.1 MFS transporter [Fervidobacterium thailandense]